MPDYLRISHSSLQVESTCARKFEFIKFYPRNRQYEDAYAADVGSALHRGLQHFLVHGDEDAAVWEFMKEFPYRLEYSEKNDFRSLEAALSTLEEMMSHPILDEYELATIEVDGEKRPAVEVPFEIRFPDLILPDGRALAYTGYVDLVMRHKMTERYRSVDIKTNRHSVHDKEPKYKFDAQQDPYGLIVEHMQGNQIDGFDVGYLDCYIDLVNPDVSMWEFEKTREHMEDWLLNIVLAFQRIQRYVELNHFPRTSGGCLAWNRPCPYFQICESKDQQTLMDWFLQGADQAEERPWNPWVVYEIDAFGQARESSDGNQS